MMVRFRFGAKWTGILPVVLLLAGCSRNPETELVKGDVSLKSGKYSEAVIHYRNAIQINPNLARAHFQLAQAYLQQKSGQAAYLELQRTVDIEPGNLEAQQQLATLLIGSSRFDEAKAVAMKILAADPNHAGAHTILGSRLALTGDPAGAAREYRIAIDRDPHRIESYFALAALHGSRGEFAAAGATFREAVQANPQSEPARLALARFYSSQKDFAAAEGELLAASNLAPRDPQPLLLLADAQVSQGKQTDAEKVCIRLKAVAPDTPEAYRALATFYANTRQPEKAFAELQALRASYPKDPWVKTSLGEALIDRNRSTEASTLIHEVLSDDPGDARALVLNGRILLSEHRYAEAQKALEQAVKGSDKNAAAWYYLGLAQQFSGLAESSRSSFAKARQLAPGAVTPQVALAEIDAGKGSYGEAERLAKEKPEFPQAGVIGARAELAKGNLRKAEEMVQPELEREPGSLPALEVLIKAYAREGRRLPEATKRLLALTAQYPQSAGLALLLGRVYFEAKDSPKAEAYVRQALTLDPRLKDAHAVLGAIKSAQGQKEEAVAEFKAEIEAHPHEDTSYLALANLYSAQSKWQDAIGTLEKARTIAGSPYVNNNLAYLYLEHGGDTNVALSLAQEARHKLPDSPLTAGTLGWAFCKIGSYQSAIEQLTISTQKLPDNPENHYHLGMAYLGARRFDLAAQSLQRALKINPHFSGAEDARAALSSISKRQRS